MLQCLSTGLIPGNRNIDDVDPAFRRFDRLFYPNESIQTSYVKAALVKSFGFGQAGGEILLVHANALLATLTPSERTMYYNRRQDREVRAFRDQQAVLTGKRTLVQVRSAVYTYFLMRCCIFCQTLAQFCALLQIGGGGSFTLERLRCVCVGVRALLCVAGNIMRLLYMICMRIP